MAPRIVEMAMRAAVEERGVAVVVIPGEVLVSRRVAKDAWDIRPVMPARSVVRPDNESLNQSCSDPQRI